MAGFADSILFITPLYAAFFGVMFVMLSWRVTSLRARFEGSSKMHSNAGHNDLTAAVRAQGNFVEYIPLSLLLMWMLETMQVNHLVIHGLGILLIVARLMHLHGLHEPSGDGITRRIGTRLTWVQIILSAGLSFAAALGFVF